MKLGLVERVACVSLLSTAAAAAGIVKPSALRARQAGGAPSGAETSNIPRPHVGSVPYGEVITSCRPGAVALTFDDGPGEYTSRLLDVLDELNVRATFFVTGNGDGHGSIDSEGNGRAEVLRRMVAGGHQVASHTWSHKSMTGEAGSRETEIMYNEMALRNVLGVIPTYFRPPYLDCDAGCSSFMAERGYHVISTNSDTKDYENDDAALIANSHARFSESVGGDASGAGYIVLAHDIHYQTVADLARYMVREARSRGYELMTVGECLGDAKENWYRSA